MTAKKWAEEENEFIKKHYQTMSNPELAEKFGVTLKAIEGKLRKLSLKRKTGVLPAKKAGEAKTAQKGKVKADRSALHRNIRCRVCLIVDGYAEKEENCRFCGSGLFRLDVL